MPPRGKKKLQEAGTPPAVEKNARPCSAPSQDGSPLMRGEGKLEGAIRAELVQMDGALQRELEKDGSSSQGGAAGNPKRKAEDAHPNRSRDFRWAPPMTAGARGGKQSLMGVGSFAGVAAALGSTPPLSVPAMLESPLSQAGGLLSPVSAAGLFAQGGAASESSAGGGAMRVDKLPPKSPVLQALSNGHGFPAGANGAGLASLSGSQLSGGSMGGVNVGNGGLLHPSLQGHILQQPKIEFAPPPSPTPQNLNQELLQRIQQESKRQEAAQQHFFALQQKIQQQQLQQQKLLQGLHNPPPPKPLISAPPSRNDSAASLANQAPNPAFNRARTPSASNSFGGVSAQTNAVPMYISQADKLPPRNPGTGARRLMQYMYHQRKRSVDNSYEFWRQFVTEYFAPGGKKRWCVSCYSHNGRQPAGVFPQEVWHCELCGADPGRGFETTAEVLPRLFQVKYDSGVQDELLYVDIPNEYMLASGVHVLEYNRAVQESVFDQLRVVRQGQLRIVFSTEAKILSWEFCAHGHEEHVPRRNLLAQAAELAFLSDKLQSAVRTPEDLQTHCTALAAVTKQLALNLEQPTVNDLGFTKRYVRCLQIAEVVDNMKDLISYNKDSGLGPINSLNSYSARFESTRSSRPQVARQGGTEAGEHNPPFRDESRLAQPQSFSANEPNPEAAFQQYMQQKLGHSPQPEGPVAMRSPLTNLPGLRLSATPAVQTGPEQMPGDSLGDQFSSAGILRGPAKHGMDRPSTAGSAGDFRLPDLGSGLTSMSQIQALLMGNDEDDLDVGGLGVSDLQEDFMFR